MRDMKHVPQIGFSFLKIFFDNNDFLICSDEKHSLCLKSKENFMAKQTKLTKEEKQLTISAYETLFAVK